VSSHSLVEAGAIGAELNLGKYCTASLMVQCISSDNRGRLRRS
jgi:hypothetical protein